VPETTAASKRGYVFAMWTFHYEENTSQGKNKGGRQVPRDDQYVAGNPKPTAGANFGDDDYPNFSPFECICECTEPPTGSVMISQHNQNMVDVDYCLGKKGDGLCPNMSSRDGGGACTSDEDCGSSQLFNGKGGGTCTDGKCVCAGDRRGPHEDVAATAGLQCSSCEFGPSKKRSKPYPQGYTVWNHEIDIEIPANSPFKSGTDYKHEDKYHWGTMNLNNWLTDNQLYDNTSWYRQVAAERKKRETTWVAPNPEATNGPPEFHKYSIDWRVPKDGSDPYVDFYFDDEFVYRESCFVPSRAGRFTIGPWFGWWGFDGKHGDTHNYKADFDLVKVLIREIKITPDPDSTLVEYPQIYAQYMPWGDTGTGSEICDIRKLNGDTCKATKEVV
jgi:hypothetical protein